MHSHECSILHLSYDQVLSSTLTRYGRNEPFFQIRGALLRRKFRYLTPRGSWGGACARPQKNNQGNIGGSEQPLARVVVRAKHRVLETFWAEQESEAKLGFELGSVDS